MLVAYLLPAILLGLAAFIAIINAMLAWIGYRQRMQGSPRSVTLIYLIAQLLVGVSALAAVISGVSIPSWLYWTVALADVSLYSVVYSPFAVIREQARAHKKDDHTGRGTGS